MKGSFAELHLAWLGYLILLSTLFSIAAFLHLPARGLVIFQYFAPQPHHRWSSLTMAGHYWNRRAACLMFFVPESIRLIGLNSFCKHQIPKLAGNLFQIHTAQLLNNSHVGLCAICKKWRGIADCPSPIGSFEARDLGHPCVEALVKGFAARAKILMLAGYCEALFLKGSCVIRVISLHARTFSLSSSMAFFCAMFLLGRAWCANPCPLSAL